MYMGVRRLTKERDGTDVAKRRAPLLRPEWYRRRRRRREESHGTQFYDGTSTTVVRRTSTVPVVLSHKSSVYGHGLISLIRVEKEKSRLFNIGHYCRP